MLETATQSVKSPATQGDTAQRALIDRSMRLPVIFFFTSGMLWLLISMVLGLLASIALATMVSNNIVLPLWLRAQGTAASRAGRNAIEACRVPSGLTA